jgi:hypothetical protein
MIPSYVQDTTSASGAPVRANGQFPTNSWPTNQCQMTVSASDAKAFDLKEKASDIYSMIELPNIQWHCA